MTRAFSRRTTCIILAMFLLLTFFSTLTSSQYLCRSVGWLGCIDVGCSNGSRGYCRNFGDRPHNDCKCVMYW
ncbi:hypothetical protein DPMN_079314 [Dreissena polymorpha]|uniref:Defensin n=1 Tax=Dreissena polymorpha TaxID=45954 RepID=A0A9D3YS14_DREPO|nr:hypothetical protein DPMN_079314 [Dreissena polymorpha]